MNTLSGATHELEALLLGADPFIPYMYETARVPKQVLLDALARCKEKTPKIGQIALERRCLNVRQVFAVLEQQVDSGQRFGQIAIRLGYMTEQTMADLLREQQHLRPNIVDVLLEMNAIKPQDLNRFEQEFRSGSPVPSQSSHRHSQAAMSTGRA
jgi:hypothetical protein